MSQIIASLYAEIGAKTDGFTTGAAKVKGDLGGLASSLSRTTGQFNSEFKSALLGGKANMDMFGKSLLDQADKAGLTTAQINKMAGATGIYSDTQILAAQSSANVAAKAQELTAAVAKGEMTTREAGEAFKAYAETQVVAEAVTVSFQQVLMVGIPIILATAAALYQAEKAADAAARGDARLESVINSTGAAAGYNFKQLDQMAQGLSKLTGIDDDVIKKSEAVELTFTNIGHNIFPQAAKAALDLSAVLGTDLQGATIQVDKALNDFSGYTALKRAGVSFSDEQIKQIKNFKATNDLASYQKLILAELTKEFGGAAAAIHNAGDKSEDVAIAWGNLTENAGGGLVPALRGVNVYLTESIDGWNKFFQGLNAGNTQMSRSIQGLIDWGVAAAGPIAWIAKWMSATGLQMDAQNNLNASIQDGIDATNDASDANKAYVPTAEEVEAANKAISEANIAMVGTIQQMQDADESYAESVKNSAKDRQKAQEEYQKSLEKSSVSAQSEMEKYNDAIAKNSQLQAENADNQSKLIDLQQQRIDIDQRHADAMSENAGKTAEINSDYQASLDAIAQKEADLAAERDKQTLQFISNILLQKLEVDGFTTAEFEAFAKQQEAWGLWSADTVAKAQAAWMEADKVAASIDAIPTEKTSTITTIHNDVYGQQGGLIGPPAPDGSTPSAQDYNPYGLGGRWGANGEQVPYVNPGDQSLTGQGYQSQSGLDKFNLDGGSYQSPTFHYSPHADGGTFMIPASYGNEGFRMGGGDTASGGERLQIIPSGKSGTDTVNWDRVARLFSVAVRDELQKLGR